MNNKELPKALERLSEAHKNNPYNGIVSIPAYEHKAWQRSIVVKCPDCGNDKFSHNPLDNSKYICKECGCNYGDK